MGMYTEFHFNARLKKDIPEYVINILKFMVGQLDDKQDHEIKELEKQGNHELFKTDRWTIMLNCSSYYFGMITNSQIRFDDISKGYTLSIRTNFKDYGDEVDKFIDWIDPFLDEYDELLGFYRYEESKYPTLIYPGKKLIFVGDLIKNEKTT